MRLGPTRRPARVNLRRTGVAATCVALASTLAACGLGSGSGDDNDDEIVIGISLPLTGDFSEPGKGVQRGYEAWAEHVNENGGLLGATIGAGTLAVIFLLGPCVDLASRRLRLDVHQRRAAAEKA